MHLPGLCHWQEWRTGYSSQGFRTFIYMSNCFPTHFVYIYRVADPVYELAREARKGKFANLLFSDFNRGIRTPFGLLPHHVSNYNIDVS